MNEEYDQWNREKQALNRQINFARPKKGQVWWCSIGLNIGSEQNCTDGFERPVLVLRVFGNIFWGAPITSSNPTGTKDDHPLFYKIDNVPYTTQEGLAKTLKGYIALHQMRAFDSRRLKRKILTISLDLFSKVTRAIGRLL